MPRKRRRLREEEGYQSDTTQSFRYLTFSRPLMERDDLRWRGSAASGFVQRADELYGCRCATIATPVNRGRYSSWKSVGFFPCYFCLDRICGPVRLNQSHDEDLEYWNMRDKVIRSMEARFKKSKL
jgi:hypothetical protein